MNNSAKDNSTITTAKINTKTEAMNQIGPPWLTPSLEEEIIAELSLSNKYISIRPSVERSNSILRIDTCRLGYEIDLAKIISNLPNKPSLIVDYILDDCRNKLHDMVDRIFY